MINRCSSIQAHLKLQLVDSLPFITHPIFAGRICTVAQVIIATKDNSPGAGFSSPRTKARAGFASHPTLTQASAAAGAGTGRRGVLMAHQARCPHRQALELWKLFLGGHKAPLDCRSKNKLSLGWFKPPSSPGLWGTAGLGTAMGPFSAWHGGEAGCSLGCSSGGPDPGSPALRGAARPRGVPGAALGPAPGGRTLDAGVADSAFGPRRSFCLGSTGLRSQFAAEKRPGGGRGSSVPATRGPPEPSLCPHSPAHPRRMTACPSRAGRPPVPWTAPPRTPSPSAPR